MVTGVQTCALPICALGVLNLFTQQPLQGVQPLIEARRRHVRGQRPEPQGAPRIHDEPQPPVRRIRRPQVGLDLFTGHR